MIQEALSIAFNESQLYMSKLDDKDLNEVEKLIIKYLAEKVARLADEDSKDFS